MPPFGGMVKDLAHLESQESTPNQIGPGHSEAISESSAGADPRHAASRRCCSSLQLSIVYPRRRGLRPANGILRMEGEFHHVHFQTAECVLSDGVVGTGRCTYYI